MSKTARNRNLLVGAFLAAAFVSAAAVPQASADCSSITGDWQAGRRVYQSTCIACQGRDGRGAVAGAPDFTKNGGVLAKPHQVMVDHIKNGFREPGAPMAMPPKGGNASLTDQDLDNVHAYLHHQFGCGQ